VLEHLRRVPDATPNYGFAYVELALRRQEVEEIFRRRVIRHYETLRSSFPEDHEHRRGLALSYLRLIRLLWELGRQTEATEPWRKALALDPEDPAINNDLAWFLATNSEPRLRDPALAVRLAKKAVAARPQNPDYRNTLGVTIRVETDRYSVILPRHKPPVQTRVIKHSDRHREERDLMTTSPRASVVVTGRLAAS